jgi:anti-anti-sigma factor
MTELYAESRFALCRDASQNRPFLRGGRSVALVRVDVTHRPGSGPGATVVRVAGTLEAETVDAARASIDPIVAAAPKVVVFDLGELTFLSSLGIGLLLDTRKRLTDKGSTVFLTNLQPQISKVMDIVNSLPRTAIFKNLAEMDSYLAEIQRRVREDE